MGWENENHPLNYCLQLSFLLSFLFFEATCLEDCAWRELLPPPPVGCARLFVQEESLMEKRPAHFLVSLPHPDQCKLIDINEELCPEVKLPFKDDTELIIVDGKVINEEFNEPISPPQFVKLSLFGSDTFSHAVDMLFQGNDLYGFILTPAQAGKLSLSVNVDFAECTGKHMLGLNPFDNIIFQELMLEDARERKVVGRSFHPPPFRGCGSMPLQRIATYNNLMAEPMMNKASHDSNGKCNWSNLRGGWKNISGILPYSYPKQYVVEDRNCRIPSYESESKKKNKDSPYWSSFPARSRSQNRSLLSASSGIITPQTTNVNSRGVRAKDETQEEDFDYNVCLIGDSNLRNPWPNYVLLTPDKGSLNKLPPIQLSGKKEKSQHLKMDDTTTISLRGRDGEEDEEYYYPTINAYASGGGLDIDIIKGQHFSMQRPVVGLSRPKRYDEHPFAPKESKNLKSCHNLYSWPECYEKQYTQGMVEAVVEFDKNPFDECIEQHPYTNVIIFNIGSHNHALSFQEAKHGAKLLIQKFLKWQRNSNAQGKKSEKCIVFVAMPDSRHEEIANVKDGKFGNQSHFRNSFRSNLFNKILNRTIEIEKIKLRNENVAKSSTGSESDQIKIHYLDLFQLTLGLHWMGHPTTATRVDPVHFHPDPMYFPLISTVWHAAWDLCM